MSKKMQAEEIALLYRNLALATRHQLDYQELLSILKNDTEVFAYRNVISILSRELKEGKSLTDAMSGAPGQFPAATLALIKHADKAGCLAETLEQLADDHLWLARSTKSIKTIIAWPLTILALTIVITAILSVFVIPAFVELFSSFGANLPLPTLLVIAVSNFVVDYWWVLFISFAGVAWLAKFDRLPASVSMLPVRVWLSLSFVRNYELRLFGLQLLRWLTFCHSKPELLPFALAHLKLNLRYATFGKVVDDLAYQLAKGLSVGKALDQLSSFPRRITLQIQLGERTGDVTNAISQVLEMSESDLVNALINYEKNLFIIAYLIIGLIVGTTVLAMYLPIFMMGATVA